MSKSRRTVARRALTGRQPALCNRALERESTVAHRDRNSMAMSLSEAAAATARVTIRRMSAMPRGSGRLQTRGDQLSDLPRGKDALSVTETSLTPENHGVESDGKH